ncbi:MAG: hypothetical protein QGH23_04545 [Dehalococcoidia bacterium]|jgi:acetoin utilization deacetylase AcuC-like enzyme|nr:hypothetical protein [Dehalococcoidia bacterium]MDP6782548.1 hypothetical protein [Dehalococcoidia bacterium]
MTRHIGIFFHYQQGDRLSDFPQALDGILQDHRTMLYDAHYPDKPPAGFQLQELPQDLLCQVHAPDMVAQVAKSELYQSALYSAGGVVQAAEKLRTGEIDNAFVFTGCGDHHAGWNFYGGGCYLNGAALAIARLKAIGAQRFAIVDTDPHHGDGTWDIFVEDESVLYLCLCHNPFAEQNHNVNIPIPWHTTDEDYMNLLGREVAPRARSFRPEVIFWNWGYDGTHGEYGDIGLSRDCHHRMAVLLQALADEVCKGHLIAVLCGGSGRAVATYAIPRIIRHLAGIDDHI